MTHHFHYSGAASPIFSRKSTVPLPEVDYYSGYLDGVDGIKNEFETLHYFDAASVHVELNGLVQKQDEDYYVVFTHEEGWATAIHFYETPNLIGGADEIFIRYIRIADKPIQE